ncbi:hypothetical protein ACT8ZR_09355 [Neobacillus sp. M.A.Huq-85]
MDNIITCEEKLFRMVIRNPNFWKTQEGRPSSALFKDSKGVSVDRDGKRDRSMIVNSFINRFGEDEVRAIVLVDASFCLDNNLHLVYKPEDDNEYHAEIHSSPERVPLTGSQAKKLINHCTIVYQTP